jgi:hypothetical protein
MPCAFSSHAGRLLSKGPSLVAPAAFALAIPFELALAPQLGPRRTPRACRRSTCRLPCQCRSAAQRPSGRRREPEQCELKVSDAPGQAIDAGDQLDYASVQQYRYCRFCSRLRRQALGHDAPDPRRWRQAAGADLVADPLTGDLALLRLEGKRRDPSATGKLFRGVVLAVGVLFSGSSRGQRPCARMFGRSIGAIGEARRHGGPNRPRGRVLQLGAFHTSLRRRPKSS